MNCLRVIVRTRFYQEYSPSNVSSSGTLASISPSSRDNVDPIAELLSQLSGVRRTQGSTPSQLQHLQMQLQLERQQVRVCTLEFVLFQITYFLLLTISKLNYFDYLEY